MSYEITITVPDIQLQALLKALDGRKAEVAYITDGVTPQGPKNDTQKPVATIVPASATLSVGPVSPRAGSKHELIVKTLQKLEGKHGPHRVTRGLLKNELQSMPEVANWVCSEGVIQTIRKNYIEVS